MDNQQAQSQFNSNQTFETKSKDTQSQGDIQDQLFQYNDKQMSQSLNGFINNIKVSKDTKMKKKNHLKNEQRAELEDQRRAQLQSANQQKQQIPIKQQQLPVQQQQPIQKQQQPQVFQQKPQQLQKNIINLPQTSYQQKLQGQKLATFGMINGYSPQNYNDDDPILYQYHKQVGLNMNLEELIDLRVQAQYDYCKLKKSESQRLPAMVSIITKDIEQYVKNNSSIEAGIDLLCVIDKSGSMEGKKIASVQQSLVQLLDFLSEKDRLCLITFDGSAQRLTPLKTLTQDNKNYFKKAIYSIRASGQTNIAKGTEIAFNQIQQRKMKNQVTSIFLLSDGQDQGAAEYIQRQKDVVEDIVTIHSFGYGSDHDAALMSKICKVGQGSFYYIEDVKLLDEFFADALGRLSSALAEKVQIDIKCAPFIPFQDIKIQKTYGDMWKQIEQERLYQIKIPQIASDSRKDYVFEIALPPYSEQILDEQRVPQVVQVFLQFSNTFSKQVYQKVSFLQLKLYNEDEQIGQNDANADVTREFLRVQATEAIDLARMKCEQSKNEEAELLLEQMKQNILTDEKFAKVSAQAINDIDQAKNASKRKNYVNFGMKQMYQMSVNNYQQEGLNAQFDLQGKQMQQLDQGKFQNKKQLKMVQEVQKRKP
ncbi:unnamed protein product (macronuclear) [Paramecium tetraurelia]|uniref:VWFA domain-containing protein n=1 Tax=Paramecium tetraurelia TaxID=5888 RepID=A0C9G5_PARTE|nr:uncharacterized protein GSPATT00006738001 [Paramecium tetraurelia]CAK67432.1 unnamed protein product [Paramecium tetraurelia]|eukprot:XP_001434829.1 hypothetical protein (macronuclear) [Paramecium tetraurelia strain d4-2]